MNEPRRRLTNRALHGREEWIKRIFRDQIAEAAGILEVVLSGIVLIALLMSIVPLLRLMPGLLTDADKYNTCDPHHFILEDIDTAVDFGEGTSRIYAQGKHYQILAQDGEYSQLVVNEYGKGHSVYFAGLPYSPQNCRILLRAIYYAAGMPEEMKHYYVTNVDTEVTVFPETKRIAVINNADAEEKTDLYIKGHLIDSLTLAPREMRWVDDAE